MLNLLQWPAMAVTLLAAWAVGSRSARRRKIGFWVFIASNVLWIVWGLSEQVWALIVLQVGLFVLNIRGARKNEAASSVTDS
jgi:hypothetical protein